MISIRFLLLLHLLGAAGLFAQNPTDLPVGPVSSKELGNVRELYAAAQKQEADALASFREIRALQSSRALQIPVEEARQRLQIPAPERSPIDLSVLQLSSPDPARIVEQRRTLRDLNTRVDEILTFVRQLKEQLKEDEVAAETITLEALRAEIADRKEADALAAEDPNEPSKDMTSAAAQTEAPPPADAAVTEAAIANQAATEAEKMAQEAEDAKKEVAPEAQKVAKEARDAAEEALQAAVDAKNAAAKHDEKTAAAQAEKAATKSTEAVNAAIKVAQITGNLSFVAAEQEHTEIAESSKTSQSGQDSPGLDVAGDSKTGDTKTSAAVTSAQLGGFIPGATKFLPGKARPSRRISGFGTGIEWIFIDSWYMLGPFPNPNRRNVDTPYPPESVIDLDATYSGTENKPLHWEFVQSPDPCVIPDNPGEYRIFYAYSELWCDRDMDLWVMVGSDDSSRIWVNNQQIWKSGYTLKTWRLDEGLRKVSFRRGINRILYRIENGWGSFGFSFAINLRPVPSW